MRNKWGILWRSNNKLDGKREYFLWDHYPNRASVPIVFRTREQARKYISINYGYIKNRPDLQQEPHGWKMPMPVKVHIVVEKAHAN